MKEVEERVAGLLRVVEAVERGERPFGLDIFSLPRRSRVWEVQALRARFARVGERWEVYLPRVGRARERLIGCDSVQFIPFFPTGVVVVGVREGKVVFWGRYSEEPYVYTF